MKKLRDLTGTALSTDQLTRARGGALVTIKLPPPIGLPKAQGDRTRDQTYVDGNTWDQDYDCEA